MRRIQLDHSVPTPLHAYFTAYLVETAYQRGWAALKNGDLLDVMEQAGFDVFLTADQNLRFQQNLTRRKVAVVILGSNIWPVIAANPDPIKDAVDSAQPDSIMLVPYPKPPRLRGPQP